MRLFYTIWRRAALLRAFYFHDPRMDLVPGEHLASDGIDADFRAALEARPGWTRGHVELLERAVILFWERYDDLAARAAEFSAPRLRNIGVIRRSDEIRPYAQILNESSSVLYLDDLDPTRSHPEFAAYLLALQERMCETGEVTLAPIHLAPWWFGRTQAQCDAFTRAAGQATRPDASIARAIAAALPWLRQLRHRTLRPARQRSGHRPIPQTGLLVPRAIENEPVVLLEQIRADASECVRAFHARHRGRPGDATERLRNWLVDDRPPLLVTDAGGQMLWDPERPALTDALLGRLSSCTEGVVGDLHADLVCVADHCRRFRASLRRPDSLPTVDPETEQSGYCFLHRDRQRIAYNLDEAGIERLLGPEVPYARAMLGARTAHEWAHLAVDAGWVPRHVTDTQWASLCQGLTDRLDATVASLPRATRETMDADIAALGGSGATGRSLLEIFERRLPDLQANLLAARYQTDVERETYVRHNIRPLRRDYPPPRRLRMLVRYLFEMQYLRLSEMEDPRTYFLETTWFEADFFETGILDEAGLDALDAAAAELCRAHEVDESHFHSPTAS